MYPESPVAHSWRSPKVILALVGMLLIAGIVTVSILRDRIVNRNQWTVTVMGTGKVSYQPDTATVNVGVQIDRAGSAESALNQLNGRIEKVQQVLRGLNIDQADIQTQNLSIYSQYDYINNATILGGYNANQAVAIKVRNLNDNPELVSTIINETSKAGANQINGVSFDVSNIEELKQQARLEALQDAKNRADAMATAAGVTLKKIVGWYENYVTGPGVPGPYYYDGKGAGGAIGTTVPSGQQEIMVEIGVNYLIK